MGRSGSHKLNVVVFSPLPLGEGPGVRAVKVGRNLTGLKDLLGFFIVIFTYSCTPPSPPVHGGSDPPACGGLGGYKSEGILLYSCTPPAPPYTGGSDPPACGGAGGGYKNEYYYMLFHTQF